MLKMPDRKKTAFLRLPLASKKEWSCVETAVGRFFSFSENDLISSKRRNRLGLKENIYKYININVYKCPKLDVIDYLLQSCIEEMMPLVLITLYKRENWYSTSHESLSHFMYVLVSLFSWSTPSYICFFWWMQGHYFYETLWNKPEYIYVLLFLPPYPPLPYIPYIYVSLITLGAKRGYLFETRSRAASWASPSIRNLHQGQHCQSQNSTQFQDKKGQKAAHFNYCLPFSTSQVTKKGVTNWGATQKMLASLKETTSQNQTKISFLIFLVHQGSDDALQVSSFLPAMTK